MASQELIISMDDAKTQLKKLMDSMSKSQREQLLSHAIQECMISGQETIDSGDEDYENCAEDFLEDPVSLLNSIAKKIREETSPDTIISLNNSTIIENSDDSKCDSKKNSNLDAFLYDDEDEEEHDLENGGKLEKYYCRDCKSTKIVPLKFQSYSLSKDDLYEVFNDSLPTLDDKIVLDVGSRLGCVLYGAYAYTDAAKIIGIEQNKEYCDLQNSVIEKFKMGSRIQIINEKIENALDHIRIADVVTLIHAFKFQLSETEQNHAWKLIKENIKKGAFIVSRPSIRTSLKCLDTGINVDTWVKEQKSHDQGHNAFDKNSKINDEYFKTFVYEVL